MVIIPSHTLKNRFHHGWHTLLQSAVRGAFRGHPASSPSERVLGVPGRHTLRNRAIHGALRVHPLGSPSQRVLALHGRHLRFFQPLSSWIFALGLFLLLISGPSAAAERILFFAPHPDDEAISLGGWLYDEGQKGSLVSVVFLTDGEAFTKALRAGSNKPSFLFRRYEYARLGHTRRIEAGESLKVIGVPKERQYFLGYPNNLLTRLYRMTNPNSLIWSPATTRRYGISELGGKKRPPSPFSRRCLEDDLDWLLKSLQPDLVIIPHPLDSNGDHHATADMIRERCRKLNIHPKFRGYLVHIGSRKNYPRPFGYHPEENLDDPPGFPAPLRYSPSAEALMVKEKALRCHRSQMSLRDGFLLSFIRRKELYWPVAELPDRAK